MIGYLDLGSLFGGALEFDGGWSLESLGSTLPFLIVFSETLRTIPFDEPGNLCPEYIDIACLAS